MNKKPLFLLVSISILLSSCTIEKRLFQPGYNIEWNKKFRQKSSNESVDLTLNQRKESDSTTSDPYSNLLTNVPEIPTVAENKCQTEITETNLKLDRQTETDPVTTINCQKSENKEANISPKKTLEIIEEGNSRQFETLGIMSFGLYFTSLALTIIGIILFNSGYLLIAAAFLMLLSLIFGIISVDIYRHNKEKYRRNFFGYFGMIASMATITLGLGILILAFVAGSF